LAVSNYVLRGGAAGAERLRLLARVTWPTTEPLLRRAGLGPGLRCLDVGCGLGAVTLEMARSVGSGGQALGFDTDEAALRFARDEAARQWLPATFRAGSALALAEDAAHDLVFARFLLSHLPDPAVAARGLVRAARPGGVVVVEDTDFAGHFSHPACPAFDRYVAVYREVVRRGGGDACVGPRLPALLEDAGLQDVQLTVVQPVYRTGEGKSLAAVTLEHIREAVTAAGLASPQEVGEIIATMDDFTRDPRTIVSLPRLFQVWGRKTPGGR
jgi:SAM-dependent methyltransferase